MFRLNKYSGSTTRLNIRKGVPYITFPALNKFDWVINGFSTRIGGVSSEHLYSMNLGFARGDKEENVVKNFEIISETIGFDSHNIVTGQQTHTTNIRIVTKDDLGKGVYRERDYIDIDGLITNEKNVVLAAFFADCTPLLIVDTKNKVISVCHSGWRGTVAKIGQKSIEIMTKEYGTDVKDIVVCIGPAICKNCYEVGKEVVEEFEKVFPDDYSNIVTEKDNGKFDLDLWETNRIIFKNCGVLEENIHVSDICTCCNLDIMYSHRGHKGMRGNMAAFLCIK